ncbi:hypothetical protein D3C81_1112420 [compost metagenome]
MLDAIQFGQRSMEAPVTQIGGESLLRQQDTLDIDVMKLPYPRQPMLQFVQHPLQGFAHEQQVGTDVVAGVTGHAQVATGLAAFECGERLLSSVRHRSGPRADLIERHQRACAPGFVALLVGDFKRHFGEGLPVHIFAIAFGNHHAKPGKTVTAAWRGAMQQCEFDHFCQMQKTNVVVDEERRNQRTEQLHGRFDRRVIGLGQMHQIGDAACAYILTNLGKCQGQIVLRGPALKGNIEQGQTVQRLGDRPLVIGVQRAQGGP